jgi:hypothetical protein
MADDEFDDDGVASDQVAEPGKKQKIAEQVSTARPWLERALLNLRVWLPALRTPYMKARQLKYRASDARSGMTWKVGLPQQCYACGKTEGLTLHKFSQELRVFDSPMTILGGAFGLTTVLSVVFLLTSFKPTFLILAVVAAIFGVVFQFIKSWKERVKISIWSCAEHRDELTPPEVVSHDEDLYIYLPHESLVEPARAEMIASRKKDQKQRPPLAPEKVARPQNATAPADAGEMPPSRPIGSRTELPPLKLSGEDDE